MRHNEKITAHNAMVANLTAECNKLSEDVWAFLAHSEIAEAYKGYCDEKGGVQKAMDALSAKITKAEEDRRDRERTIQQLEKAVTSIQPTVNEINRLLRGFGFRSFYLEAMDGNLLSVMSPGRLGCTGYPQRRGTQFHHVPVLLSSSEGQHERSWFERGSGCRV